MAAAPLTSKFQAEFLRAYAELVAEPLVAPTASSEAPAVHDELAFLAPFSGFPGARASSDEEMHLWNAAQFEVPTFDYNEVCKPSTLGFLGSEPSCPRRAR